MAQGFKLVLRPSKPGEKDSEKKFYAVSKTNGTSSMKTLCKLISARSTVSSADVKAASGGAYRKARRYREFSDLGEQ